MYHSCTVTLTRNTRSSQLSVTQPQSDNDKQLYTTAYAGTMMRSKDAHGEPHATCVSTWRCAESQHPLLPLKKQPYLHEGS